MNWVCTPRDLSGRGAPKAMTSSAPQPQIEEGGRETGSRLAVPTVWVFALFLAFSAVRMPVPAPNEPHFLTKAKRFWDASFCPGDFFLDSSSPHFVFYASIGWLTPFLKLEQTAICGRIAALLLLAVGWTWFVSRLLPGRWAGLWAAAVFLAMAAVGNFSGEWMVGGVEGKVFSYAFVFLALAAVFDGKQIRAGLFGGLAISFHPVVGIWALACAAFAAIVEWIVRPGHPSLNEPRIPVVRGLVGGLTVLAVCALPGLIPALKMIGSAPPDVQYQADYIQVFYRLKHHLDPMEFTGRQYAGYAVLLVGWLVGCHLTKRTRAELWFGWFVLGAVLVALIGLLVGYGERPAEQMPNFALRASLLKFYPFRLADVMLPVACSVVIVSLLQRARGRLDQPPVGAPPAADGAARPGWAACLLFGLTTAFALLVPTRSLDRNPSNMDPQQLADWKNACRWIVESTPPDAQFLTPRNSWAFKWYAHRAEYVSLKDCPQDAAGIVEWNRRLRYRTDWSRRHFHNGYSMEALQELQRETGVTHILATRPVRLPLKPIYGNAHYRVYRLGDANGEP